LPGEPAMGFLAEVVKVQLVDEPFDGQVDLPAR
jgi:hypothetical protein